MSGWYLPYGGIFHGDGVNLINRNVLKIDVVAVVE